MGGWGVALDHAGGDGGVGVRVLAVHALHAL